MVDCKHSFVSDLYNMHLGDSFTICIVYFDVASFFVNYI